MSEKYVSIIFIISMLIFSQLSAQETKNNEINNPGEVSKSQNSYSEITWEPTTSVFLELLGKGWYSVNIDFRRKATSSISVGLQYAEGIWPSFMYYRFFGEKHGLETGAGVSGIINNVGVAGMTINGVFGYRYQKKKGLGKPNPY